MEARLLASVLQTDTHKRLTAADEITDYLKRDENNLEDFAELDRLVAGLAAWMGSSNFKVSVVSGSSTFIGHNLNFNMGCI